MSESEESKFLQALDWLYNKAIEMGYFDGAYQLAHGYTRKIPITYPSVREAAQALVQNEALKAGGSGFVTGLGGLATLPITLPVYVVSALYLQIRMVAAIAHMGGYDLKDPSVKTFVLGTLLKSELRDILKKFGVQLGKKLTTKLIQKISSELLIKINQAIGFRLFTKFGSKGLISFGRLIPLVGGIVSGGFDYYTTNEIGGHAIEFFLSENETPA